jgi:hypothetical protein
LGRLRPHGNFGDGRNDCGEWAKIGQNESMREEMVNRFFEAVRTMRTEFTSEMT